MNPRLIAVVARKELAALLTQATGWLFLGAFVLASLFWVFSTQRFLARNLADVRPLFEAMPLALVFLAASLAMRGWAEERRSGTLELLHSLPVDVRSLVVGKFLASMVMMGLALFLTTPFPVAVSFLGPLDWGPVIGGYLGSLLLASVYLALGLWLSSRTKSQLGALIGTVLGGSLMVALGSDAVLTMLSGPAKAVFAELGTGQRFSPIAGGLLDLRDLVYFGCLTGGFLYLNAASLELDRVDGQSLLGTATRRHWWGLGALLAVNALLLNTWMAPLGATRVDLTEEGRFSVHQVSRDKLAALREPLQIQGFFSERSHPLLTPLIPAVKDLLTVYDAASDNVTVSFADPTLDPELEEELGTTYGIRSVPFGVTDRHSQGVVNAFFHVLVTYGDQHEVLSFDDLIEVNASNQGLDVRLKSLEHDVTAAIAKVSAEFDSLATVMAELSEPAELTWWISGDLPPHAVEAATALREAGESLSNQSGGMLQVKEQDPSSDQQLAVQLAEKGIRPIPADLFGTQLFYLYGSLTINGEEHWLQLPPDLDTTGVSDALEASIRRTIPGQLPSIGLFAGGEEDARPRFNFLEQTLSETHRVERPDLSDGVVPDHLDLMFAGSLTNVSEEELYALDQYLLRGGNLVVMAGPEVEASGSGLNAKPVASNAREFLEHHGVSVGEELVMSDSSVSLPVPVKERRAGFVVERVAMLPYPLIPDIRGDGLSDDVPVVSRLMGLTLPWSHPLDVVERDDVASSVWVQSDASSWLSAGLDVQPDLQRHPNGGFPSAGGPRESSDLVVELEGTFSSFFEGKPNPVWEGSTGDEEHGVGLVKSAAPGRLVVLGSSAIFDDLVAGLAQQPGGEAHVMNATLAQNIVDWAVADEEMLAIRSGGAFARTLVPLTERQSSLVELSVAASSGILWLLLIGLSRFRGVSPIRMNAHSSEVAS